MFIGATPVSCPAASSAISHYADFLKGRYERCSVSNDGKFPPTPSKKYINLALVHHKPRDLDEVMKHTLHGNVAEILKNKEEINIDDIFEHHSHLALVLVEGPPGVGKSTFAWELCRKWDEIPSMRHYNLVVLLRLRDKYVQQMREIDDLFYHQNGDLKKAVSKEVINSHGKGVLFILDGFDELPSSLRCDGLLINIITGHDLPKSTVIVTSRPSATADFLSSSDLQVQKHVEILGFTQECVEKYASSVFSSEPEMLSDFLTYISASSSPAINSLMYIPLNAAIVVNIYRNSRRTGCPIPKTLTQLYTRLCLIILQRYLKDRSDHIPLNKFTDLPEEYLRHFLKLSELAFEGFKENEVIFYSDALPGDLVHFGFLDTVLSFYIEGGASHNFLHLTFQEFLTAYHISQLPHHDRQEVFKQYCNHYRWNVVWRFVAGLTCLESFWHEAINKAFVTIRENKCMLSRKFLQCLYEVQISDFDFAATFGTNEVSASWAFGPLEKYALGYCIAISAPTASWEVMLAEGPSDSFIWGLKSRKQCKGTVTKITASDCSLTAFKECPTSILHSITDLTLYGPLDNHSTEVISLFNNLNTLEIGPSVAAKVFNQLSNIKLTSLTIGNVDSRDYELLNADTLNALAKLISPVTGNLRTLSINNINHYSKELSDVVFGSSSLQELRIDLCDLGSLAPLQTNTCLTHLTFHIFEWSEKHAKYVGRVLEKNTTLQCLVLRYSVLSSVKIVDLFGPVLNGLKKNTILQTLKVYHSSDVVSNLSEYDLDSRIIWCKLLKKVFFNFFL